MSAIYPCPNPACDHIFDLDAIQGVTSLACPKCGMVFRFRSRNAPTETAPAPTIPLAMPVARTAAPAVAAESALDFGSDIVRAPTARRGKPRPRSRYSKLWLGAMYAGALAVAVFVVCWIALSFLGKPTEKDITNRDTGNFQFKPPPSPWEEAPEVVSAFRPVQYAYRKAGALPNNMALYYRDYERRNPTESELVTEGLAKLRLYFDRLEYDLRPRNDADTLGDKPATVIEFRGFATRPEPLFCFGECWITSYRGYAYWFFTWAPLPPEEEVDKRDKAAADWPGLRKRFSILDGREGWREAPRKTTTYRGTKAPFEMKYDDKVWTREDEEGTELSLLGQDPRLTRREQHAGKAARLKIYWVEKKAADLDEAIKIAKDDLLERKKERDAAGGTYLYPDTKITDAKDDSLRKGEPAKKLGSLDGRILPLLVENTPQRVRYVVLGVALLADGILVIEGDCDSTRKTEDDPKRPDRDFWDQEIMAVLATVGPRKGS